MRKAFSLVELSIVLVILGLLTGGILAGQSLIRASELRTIATQSHSFATAASAFRDKYFAIPGDFATATKFWGEQATGTGACASTDPDGTPGTCNGNGDGALGDGTLEMHRFWQHLAMAGLVEGSYTGINYGGSSWGVLGGTNAPAGRVSNSTWGATTKVTPYSGHAENYDGFAGDWLVFGGHRSGFPVAGILTGAELWNIDTKLDDGKPARGRITSTQLNGWNNAGGTLDRCTTSASSAETSKDYDLDAPGRNCAANFSDYF